MGLSGSGLQNDPGSLPDAFGAPYLIGGVVNDPGSPPESSGTGQALGETINDPGSPPEAMRSMQEVDNDPGSLPESSGSSSPAILRPNYQIPPAEMQHKSAPKFNQEGNLVFCSSPPAEPQCYPPPAGKQRTLEVPPAETQPPDLQLTPPAETQPLSIRLHPPAETQSYFIGDKDCVTETQEYFIGESEDEGNLAEVEGIHSSHGCGLSSRGLNCSNSLTRRSDEGS